MANIKSGASSDLWSIDAASKAGRVTLYDARGNPLGMKASYAASQNNTASTAGTGIFAAIIGSASKVVRVQRIVIFGTCATAAIGVPIGLAYRTSPSASASSTLTNVSKDSSSGAGTATVKYYTTNGTAGTGGGLICTQTIYLPTASTDAVRLETIFEWGTQQMGEPPVLRGVTQALELNFGITTTNAPTLAVTFEWTEE